VVIVSFKITRRLHIRRDWRSAPNYTWI